MTGGCGFIGSHLTKYLLDNTDWEIVILDKLNYASEGFDRLRKLDIYKNERLTVLSADFINSIPEGLEKEIGEVDYIIHMGAESHVARSIEDSMNFVINNITGTVRMLEFAKKKNIEKFIYFSTDEVFGSAPEGKSFKEEDRHNPGNPYSASKAGAEDICIAYANTYKMPIMITRTMNIFGSLQHSEKFIPTIVDSILNEKTLKIHSIKGKPAKRFYLNVENLANATLFLLERVNEFLDAEDDRKGKFNIGGEKEFDNLQLARLAASILGKPLIYELSESDRPGCDTRYSVDETKIRRLGWNPPKKFKEEFKKVILSYVN